MPVGCRCGGSVELALAAPLVVGLLLVLVVLKQCSCLEPFLSITNILVIAVFSNTWRVIFLAHRHHRLGFLPSGKIFCFRFSQKPPWLPLLFLRDPVATVGFGCRVQFRFLTPNLETGVSKLHRTRNKICVAASRFVDLRLRCCGKEDPFFLSKRDMLVRYLLSRQTRNQNCHACHPCHVGMQPCIMAYACIIQIT